MVRVIPREEVKEKEPTFVKVIFWIAFIVLIISGGLAFLVDWQTNVSKDKLADIEEKLLSVGTKEQKDLKDYIVNNKKKIEDMVVLLSDHRIPSTIFTILETNIHPNVIISDMSYRGVGQDKISLNGKVTDLTSMAQQMVIFQRDERIEKVSLSSVTGDKESKVSFRVELTLKPGALVMK